MKLPHPLHTTVCLPFAAGAIALLAAFSVTSSASAQVLTLDFAGGNGTSSVDQYQGIAGSGWNTAWSQSIGAQTDNASLTVTNTSPLYSGGGNYLNISYD